MGRDDMEHDIREYRKRIDQLEEELNELQEINTVLESANGYLDQQCKKLQAKLDEIEKWCGCGSSYHYDSSDIKFGYAEAQEAVLQSIRGDEL